MLDGFADQFEPALQTNNIGQFARRKNIQRHDTKMHLILMNVDSQSTLNYTVPLNEHRWED